MKLPNRSDCYRLFCEQEMMEHIMDHSLQVCRVAVFLADQLNHNGSRLDRGVVEAGALLHDITKTRSFTTGEDHAATGEVLLKEIGFEAVGRVVGQHVVLENYPVSGHVSEAEIVNYADKRVLHEKIVSLSERMHYILERYAVTESLRERWKWFYEKTRGLETRIFSSLSFGPDDIAGRIEQEGGKGIYQDFQD